METRIDPYSLLVRDADSTFFLRAQDGAPGLGVNENDILVVDRGAEALDGKPVVATLDGEMRIMRLARQDGRAFLEADGERLEITGREHVYIWGVVKWILRET